MKNMVFKTKRAAFMKDEKKLDEVIIVTIHNIERGTMGTQAKFSLKKTKTIMFIGQDIREIRLERCLLMHPFPNPHLPADQSKQNLGCHAFCK